MEDMRDPALRKSYYHGVGGPITVENYKFNSPLIDIFWEAVKELKVENLEGDINGKSQTGFTKPHATVRNGLRCSANKGYLRPASKRPNLDIMINAFVRKINIDPETKVANSVEFDLFGLPHTAHSHREIILSGGAINSPQILMLSGVGPRDHLQEFDIDVIKHAPGVADGGMIGRTASGVSVDNYANVFEPVIYKDSYIITPLLMRPRSRGRIRLQSILPRKHPLIYANYFKDPYDLAVLVEGLKYAHAFSQTKILRYLNATLNIYSWRNFGCFLIILIF
uniref:Glucose-methanol-choline oxidoreductase N-terminal domain-containing protein n=1 Tax=Megaselia scalaris TaxID=36166 RepID=T1GY45_MEGSC